MMVVSEIAVFDLADPSKILLGPAGMPLREGQASVPLPPGYSDDTFVWDKTTRRMVEDPAKLQAKLVAAIKADAEDRKMVHLTEGSAKAMEYAAKEREVNAWDSLGGTAASILIAFNAMSADRRQTSFPFVLAEAGLSGEKPADVIARFKAGIRAAASVPQIAAIEAVAVRAVMAAGSVQAIRAAAEVKWPSQS